MERDKTLDKLIGILGPYTPEGQPLKNSSFSQVNLMEANKLLASLKKPSKTRIKPFDLEALPPPGKRTYAYKKPIADYIRKRGIEIGNELNYTGLLLNTILGYLDNDGYKKIKKK